MKTNEDNIKEFKKIRKKFLASRRQFGEVFLGKTENAVINYEIGRTAIPKYIMMLARTWEHYLDFIRGE